MPDKELKNKLILIENYISSGNYKMAYNIFTNINKDQLEDQDKKKYEQYEKILRLDKIYLLVSLVLAIMVITYFVIVK
jgi:hypothetical protein